MTLTMRGKSASCVGPTEQSSISCNCKSRLLGGFVHCFYQFCLSCSLVLIPLLRCEIRLTAGCPKTDRNRVFLISLDYE
jgi:hypothetical protein